MDDVDRAYQRHLNEIRRCAAAERAEISVLIKNIVREACQGLSLSSMHNVSKPKNSRKKRRVLSVIEKEEMAFMAKCGQSVKDIAIHYNVSRSAVRKYI